MMMKMMMMKRPPPSSPPLLLLVVLLAAVAVAVVDGKLSIDGPVCEGFEFHLVADDIKSDEVLYHWKQKDMDPITGTAPKQQTTSKGYITYIYAKNMPSGVRGRAVFNSGEMTPGETVVVGLCKDTGYSMLNGVRNAPLECREILTNVVVKPSDDKVCGERFPFRVSEFPINKLVHLHLLKDYQLIVDSLLIDKLQVAVEVKSHFRKSVDDKAETDIVVRVPNGGQDLLSVLVKSQWPSWGESPPKCALKITLPANDVVLNLKMLRPAASGKDQESQIIELTAALADAFVNKLTIDWSGLTSGAGCGLGALSLALKAEKMQKKVSGVVVSNVVKPMVDMFVRSLASYVAQDPCFAAAWLSDVDDVHDKDAFTLRATFDPNGQKIQLSFLHRLIEFFVPPAKRKGLSAAFEIFPSDNVNGRMYAPKVITEAHIKTDLIDEALKRFSNPDTTQRFTVLKYRVMALTTVLGSAFADRSFLRSAVLETPENSYWAFDEIPKKEQDSYFNQGMNKIFHKTSDTHKPHTKHSVGIPTDSVLRVKCLQSQLRNEHNALRDDPSFGPEDKYVADSTLKRDKMFVDDSQKLKTAILSTQKTELTGSRRHVRRESSQLSRSGSRNAFLQTLMSMSDGPPRPATKNDGDMKNSWRFTYFDGQEIYSSAMVKLYLRRMVIDSFGVKVAVRREQDRVQKKTVLEVSSDSAKQCTSPRCDGIRVRLFLAKHAPKANEQDRLDDTTVVTIRLPVNKDLFTAKLSTVMEGVAEVLPRLTANLELDIQDLKKDLDIDISAKNGAGGWTIAGLLTNMGVDSILSMLRHWYMNKIESMVRSFGGFCIRHPCIQKNWMDKQNAMEAATLRFLFSDEGLDLKVDMGQNLNDVVSHFIQGAALRAAGLRADVKYGEADEVVLTVTTQRPPSSTSTDPTLRRAFTNAFNRMIGGSGEVAEKQVVSGGGLVLRAVSELWYNSTDAATDYYNGKVWKQAVVQHTDIYLRRECSARYWESYVSALEKQKASNSRAVIGKAKVADPVTGVEVAGAAVLGADREFTYETIVDEHGTVVTDNKQLNIMLQSAKARYQIYKLRMDQLRRVEDLVKTHRKLQGQLKQMDSIKSRIEQAKQAFDAAEKEQYEAIQQLTNIRYAYKKTHNPFKKINLWWKKNKQRKAVSRGRRRLDTLLQLAGVKADKELQALFEEEQKLEREYYERRAMMAQATWDIKPKHQLPSTRDLRTARRGDGSHSVSVSSGVSRSASSDSVLNKSKGSGSGSGSGRHSAPARSHTVPNRGKPKQL